MTTNYYNPTDPNLIYLQSRAEVDPALVAEYAAMMADGVQFHPARAVAEGYTVYVYDGYHRGQAAQKAGQLLLVSVKPGTKAEAEWLALAANQDHGLRRSTADKQKIVKLALAHEFGAKLSDRQIAQHCGVDHKTVGKIRADLQTTGEIPQSDSRIGADGREINTANIGSQPADYVSIWQLEQGVRDWLSELDNIESQINTLEEIKQKTLTGRDYLEQILTQNILPGPRRKSDVIQACNNVLAQLKERQWKLQRAEYIKTLTCLCGQQTLEPVGEMNSIRCKICGKEWLSVADFERAKRGAAGPETADPDTALAIPACPRCGMAVRQVPDGTLKCVNIDCEGWWENLMAYQGASNTPLTDAVMALPEEEKEIALNDPATYEAMGHELAEAGLDGEFTSRAGPISIKPEWLDHLSLRVYGFPKTCPTGLANPINGANCIPCQFHRYTTHGHWVCYHPAHQEPPTAEELEGEGEWDFTGMTAADLEAALATLERDGLPLDSPHANRLREELAARRDGPAPRQVLDPTGELTRRALQLNSAYALTNDRLSGIIEFEDKIYACTGGVDATSAGYKMATLTEIVESEGWTGPTKTYREACRQKVFTRTGQRAKHGDNEWVLTDRELTLRWEFEPGERPTPNPLTDRRQRLRLRFAALVEKVEETALCDALDRWLGEMEKEISQVYLAEIV